MQSVKFFLVLLIAPFIGLCIAVSGLDVSTDHLLLPTKNVTASIDSIEESFCDMEGKFGAIKAQVDVQKSGYEEQEQTLSGLTGQASEHKKMSDQIYEDRILTMLGSPVRMHKSKRVEVKVFKLDELDYRGYIAKVKLLNPTVAKVILAKDKLGEKETTLEAVKRTGAILGINAGGFYTEMREGKPYGIHIGNIVIDGKLVGDFNGYPGTLSFSGIDRKGNLIGGIMSEEEELMALDPWQGVSFIPVLIRGGVKCNIPTEWEKTKQPRTIVGEYANGDLILIVVDGRQSDWSSGVTLERLIDKLIELGVKEGYNLDGGGSSAFVYKDEVLNRPSDGKLRPVVTNIVIMP